jgi:tetratricopeptide (TPR) repeat protein
LLIGVGLLVPLAVWAWYEPVTLQLLHRGPLERLERYSQTHPDSVAAQELLAASYLNTDRPQDAAKLLTPLVERYPERLEFRRQLARALLALGETRAAYAHLQVAVHDLKAADADTFYWLGRAEESADQGDAALGHFQEALGKDPRHVPTLIRLAQIAVLSNRYSEAETYFRQAAAADPKSIVAAVGVAEMAFHGGNLPDSIAAARRAIALAPQDTAANLWLGRALQAQDVQQYGDEAEAAYRRALVTSTEKWEPRFYLAQLLRERGRLAEAESELETNVRENPLHETSFYELSLCARALGHTERAASAMQRFRRLNRLSLEAAQLEYQLKVSPGDLPLRLQLARLYVRNGRPDLARPEVERILRVKPDDRQAKQLAAEIAAHPEPTL